MNTSPNDSDCFAGTYAEARSAWLKAVARLGGHLSELQHPEVGPQGEALWLDVARFGDPEPDSTFVVSCGTHGIEGYAGSAVQTAWLRAGGPGELPPGKAVVLVHAINPWGFAHGQRVTENNVDLNRNFVDFASMPAPHAGYAEMHPHLMLERWDEAEIARAFAAMDAFRGRAGEQAFSDAFNGGQYQSPDGLFFGGRQPEWSNRALSQCVPQALGPARRCVWVDLHTGIGPYGQPFFFNFDTPGSWGRQRALEVWGEEAFSGKGATHKAFAVYQGTMIDALATMVPECAMSPVVIEFGTHERRRMQRAHLAMAWMRRQHTVSEAFERAAAEYREAFVPSDPLWRASVLREGVALCRRGRDALVAEVV
jgi:succinylglutamate desuccinylase